MSSHERDREHIQHTLEGHYEFGFDPAKDQWECRCDAPLTGDDIGEAHLAHQTDVLTELLTDVAARKWDQGFTACHLEHTKQRHNPTHAIERHNPHRKAEQ